MNMCLTEKEKKTEHIKTNIKFFSAVGVGALIVLFFIFPYMQIIANTKNYILSGFDILTLPGVEIVGLDKTAIIKFSTYMKASVLLGAISPICGILFLIFKKFRFAGISFAICALTPLMSLINIANIKNQIIDLNISSNRLYIGFLWPFFLILIGGLICSVLSLWLRGGEKLAESVFFCFACVSVGSVLFVTLYMALSGIPAISEIGLFKFLFGTKWNPSKQVYGILPLILSSIFGAAGAIIVGVPIGILAAVFLSEVSSKKIASLIRPVVELLAGIPSVIYGFFGMLVIVPLIRNLFFGLTTLDGKPIIGDSLLAVIIVLAIMVLPTIISTAETSLRAVPISYREASLGLGATPTQTIFKVTVPAAKSGILSGVVLGVGRAIGETMAVIMVAGNIANMPELLGSVRLLTTGIAIDMAYSSGLFRQALFGIGLVLFVFIMIVNISFMLISKRGVQIDANS